VLGNGALTNVSYVTIPADAAHSAGAQVVANLLLDPRLQAIKADPEVLGNPTVLDRERLPADAAKRFAAIGRSPHLPRDFGAAVQELAADRVEPLEARWKRDVLR
jgi:putative thiamine transport system substrate-binding protein